MIIKYCTYPVISNGFQTVHWLSPEYNGLEKIAYPLTDEINTAVSTLSYEKDYIYLLINALGASEYWGQNINADRFYSDQLAYTGPQYGHKTFLNGHLFAHHTNKDPNKAFGDILKSVWNSHMQRVELLVRVDKNKGHSTGNGSIIDKLEAGEFTDTSMGTKVPYDLCTYCYDKEKYKKYEETYNPGLHKSVSQAVLIAHKLDPVRGLSRTRSDYCEHLKSMRGKILPDGQQVGMVNMYPKFFDISVVFMGADRTSKVMAFFWPPKEYRPKHIIFPGSIEPNMGSMEKSASVNNDFIKTALFGGKEIYDNEGMEKESDIVKRVVTNFRRKLDDFNRKEKDIPPQQLDEAVDSLPDMSPDAKLSRILSTLTALGIILKGPEFQRLVLCVEGQKPLANKLEEKGLRFHPSDIIGDASFKLDSDFFREDLADRYKDLIPSRSFLHPFLTDRAIKFDSIIAPPERYNYFKSDLLDRIAKDYNNYRSNLLDGYSLLKHGEYAASKDPTLPYGAVPYVYAVNAHRENKSKDDKISSFIEKHPWLTAVMVIGGGLSALKAIKKSV